VNRGSATDDVSQRTVDSGPSSLDTSTN